MIRVLLVPDLPVEGWPSMDRYASRLAAELPKENPDLDVEVAAPIAPLTDDVATRRADLDGREISPARVSELGRYVRRYLLYPREVRRHRGGLLHVLDHSYAHMLRYAWGQPAIVTVHDLMPLVTVRRRATRWRDRIRNVLLRHVLDHLRRADCWIVSTEWMRGELATWLGSDDGIRVIPYGVDDAFFTPPDRSRTRLRDDLGLPDDRFVVLHVGSVVERKNIPGVFAAVDGLRQRDVPVWLLQVGGRFTAEQEAELVERRLQSATTQLPDAREADLRAAYRAADVLLFPSHYEGFGLPVLEAMASELPIVTSSAPALAEVAGDAAMVIESRDPQAYVEALERIAADAAFRRDLAARGRQRAWEFTWTETARRTGEVYRRLA